MKLSIIVPLYNSAKWLDKCLTSLVQQDIPDSEYEVICVNDGSPDNSEEIALSYAQKYKQIKVFSQENKGASGARNTGLRNAVGQYVTFVDPDDYVEPNGYGRLIRQMEDENLDMLRFNYQMVDEQYNVVEKPRSAQLIDYSSEIMEGNRFLGQRLGFACFIWTFIYRTSLLKDNDIWFCEGDYYDDTPWTPRVCRAASRVNSVDVVQYYYLQREGSLVKSSDLKSIKKKMDGRFLLIDLLQEQMRSVNDKDAMNWYQGMMAHVVLGALTSVATNDFENMNVVVKRLKELNVFPLSYHDSLPNVVKKMRIVNFSPKMYCWLLHLK